MFVIAKNVSRKGFHFISFYLNIAISCNSESEFLSNTRLRRNARISFLERREDEMTGDCWSLTCSLTPVWQTTLESGQTYPEISNLSQQNHFPHSRGRALSERPVFPPYISNKVPIKNPSLMCW